MPLYGEDAEQAAVVDWLTLHSIEHFHVPNERMISRGTKGQQMAHIARQKKLGFSPGVPDLLILDRPPRWPSAPGAAIEMKYSKGKLTANQIKWLAILDGLGWRTGTYWTWEEAVAFLQGLGYGRRG